MFDGPLPEYPFAAEGHDRLGERRSDTAFLEGAWRDGDGSRALVMRGRELAVEPGGQRLRLLTPQQAPAGERMLLGAAGGTVYFLVVVPADAPSVGADLSELRALASLLDPVQSALAVHAVSLAGWHQRHPRCSVCGAATAIAEAGASRRCPSCSTQHFPRTDPAVIMLVTDDADRCLLGHNAARDAGWYSTLAGFVEPGESPEQAVRREVKEETGVRVGRVRYAGAQPWPFPSSLMLAYFGEATTTDICVDGAEITSARWFSREQIAQEVEAGDLVVPTRISIAGALVTAWFGRELPVSPPR